MAIKGILLDKDGTIVDFWRTWVPINREVALFAARGDQALADRLLRHGGQDPETDRVAAGTVLAAGSVEAIAGAFVEVLGKTSPANLAREIDRIFTEGGAKHSVLLAGARKAVITLKQRGFRVGLATNDTAGGMQASLARHDLIAHFDFLAGCDSGFGAKPGPGMVEGFCRALGIGAGAVAVVGDSVHDLEMARAAGAGLKVAVLCGTSARADLAAHADLVVADVAALLHEPQFARAA